MSHEPFDDHRLGALRQFGLQWRDRGEVSPIYGRDLAQLGDSLVDCVEEIKRLQDQLACCHYRIVGAQTTLLTLKSTGYATVHHELDKAVAVVWDFGIAPTHQEAKAAEARLYDAKAKARTP